MELMARQKIAPEVYARWADTGESNRQIGRRLGVDESTVRRALSSIGYKRWELPVDSPEVASRFKFELDIPVVHTGDVMITADWHIPLYDPCYVNEMIRTARAEELSSLIIGGDFFNFDALSQYDPKQLDAGLERELDEGLNVMNVLLETFDTIYYVWGNHDARMHKALGFSLQFKEAMKLVFGSLGEEALERMVFTNLDHMWVEDGEEGSTPWYICHPRSYNSVPLTSARKLASKVNANVITNHSHHCAVGFGVDGQKIVAEGGGLFDKNKTAYLQRSTTYPTWVQGYSWLKDGKLMVTSPGWSLSAG
jgi:hypothetical protein